MASNKARLPKFLACTNAAVPSATLPGIIASPNCDVRTGHRNDTSSHRRVQARSVRDYRPPAHARSVDQFVVIILKLVLKHQFFCFSRGAGSVTLTALSQGFFLSSCEPFAVPARTPVSLHPAFFWSVRCRESRFTEQILLPL